MKKKLLSIILISAMLVSLAGCSKNNDENEYQPNVGDSSSLSNDETESSSVTKPNQDFGTSDVITIAEIKNKYGTLDKVEIKPFYNVDQKTQFTFHFNAKDIEPSHAVTVHTDSKCEENSTVYQISDGYLVDDGIDVVVKPGSPVLLETNDDTRYTWGKAPVYYLSINYDMDATTPTKLDEPIVVPFTVKASVGTPNVEASINTSGQFELKWKAVDGAVKYNIYEANYVRRNSPSFGMLRAECGYVGDHLNLITTVDSTVTTFDEFTLGDSGNVQTDSYGYIVSQNTFIPSNYYVAAVDASGNESQYSMAVSGWKFESQLPYTFDSYNGFEKNSMGHVSKLPSEVTVQMKDGSSASFPINFKKVSEDYGCAQYEYSIVGTLLTGKIEYENDTQSYADEVNSQSVVNYGIYQVTNDVNIVPDVSLSTLNDDAYSNSVISLDKQVSYPESSKLVYSSDALLRRADIENARIIQDGVYSEGASPRDIETYKESNQTAVPYDKNTSQTEEPSSQTEETTSQTEEPASQTEEQTEEPASQTEEQTEEPASQTEESTDTTSTPEEITSENLVQEQIESTQREVDEANQNVAPQANVVYFADSAEEEYMALMMIARQEYIDASAFPSLQNSEHLVDVIQKVIFQNPYVISPLRFGYAPEEKIILIEYAFSPEETFARQVAIAEEVDSITSSIITSGMTNEQKINAVWKYLEDNTHYDNSALEAAEASEFTNVAGHEDAFNAYGIMCNKVGVCQSYSYCYKLLLDAAGVPCITLTGFLDKTLPHAWNAVDLGNGTWYWLDATNNKNVTGIPYYLYQTSSSSAIQIDYVLDDQYDIDNNLTYVLSTDNSKDWWYQNGLCVESVIDFAQAFSKSYSMGPIDIEGNKAIAVKNIGNIQESDLTEDAIVSMIHSLYDSGMSEEELTNSSLYNVGGYIVLLY